MACIICGNTNPPIFVHGHTQCGQCGSLQEGCCEGAGNCHEAPPNKETSTDERDKQEHLDDALSQEWEST